MAVTQPRAGKERFTVSLEQLAIIAYVALATLTLIIFTGAAVRLTGSGLGCESWPNCGPGQLLPAMSGHALIEFGNRMVTGVVGLPCVLAAIGAWRLRPYRRDLIVPAVILPIGVFAQAILGGLTVLFDLSWEMVIAHYLLSAALLVAGAVLVWRIRRPEDAAAPTHDKWLVIGVRTIAAFGAYVIVAGTFATAAGPHAGGAGTGDLVERLHAFGESTLRSLIHLHGHSATIMGFSLVALWFFARRRGASAQLQLTLTVTALLMAAQGIVGLVQYHSELPAGVVWVHASLAAVLWLALVWAVLSAGRPSSTESG